MQNNQKKTHLSNLFSIYFVSKENLLSIAFHFFFESFKVKKITIDLSRTYLSSAFSGKKDLYLDRTDLFVLSLLYKTKQSPWLETKSTQREVITLKTLMLYKPWEDSFKLLNL